MVWTQALLKTIKRYLIICARSLIIQPIKNYNNNYNNNNNNNNNDNIIITKYRQVYKNYMII